ncbi:MAG TPA: sulfatase/phosphatase domain-containing protein, partial [Draconibacterium sp.]|nr:sulfatase/phosphatase domain-containing protein [Draconibacterium sp.]
EKNIFLEESAHIPMIIRLPGKIEPESVVEGYVSTMDLYATILDYTGVAGPVSDGKSLRGLIDKTDKTNGKYVVTEWLNNGDKMPGYMILKEGWKMFIPYSETSTVIDALYNLNDDPYEMNNLLGSNPDKKNYTAKVNELHTDLVNWLKEHNSVHYEGVKNRNLTGIPLSTGSIVAPEKQFRVFPNPTTGKVTIDSNDVKIDGIHVADLLGQIVFSNTESFTGQKTIDLSLLNGIFLIHPYGEYPFQSQKLIVE